METCDETDILYVEDNLDHAELVLRCLERYGVRDRVIHVEDGEKALAVLEAVKANTAVRPRLVLLDLRLPRVAGDERARGVRGAVPREAVVREGEVPDLVARRTRPLVRAGLGDDDERAAVFSEGQALRASDPSVAPERAALSAQHGDRSRGRHGEVCAVGAERERLDTAPA